MNNLSHIGSNHGTILLNNIGTVPQVQFQPRQFDIAGAKEGMTGGTNRYEQPKRAPVYEVIH